MHLIVVGMLWALRIAARSCWRLAAWGLRETWAALRVCLMGIGLLALGVVVVADVDVERELERQAVWLYRELQLLVRAPPPPLSDAPAIVWPVDSTRISSGFGSRLNPVTGKVHRHRGIDLPVPIGTPVLAAREGWVTRATEDALNGRYVVVETRDSLRFAYCHLDRLEVSVGQSVRAGQQVGLSGNTGRSTGPHLHFGAWWHREAIDPQRLRRRQVDAGSASAVRARQQY